MVSLLVFLITYSAGADAKRSRRTGPHESRTQARLLKRCEAGVGKACFDYGHNLEILEGKSKRRQSITYMRMACNLAYARACGRMSPPENLKLHSDRRAKSKANRSAGTSAKIIRPSRATASVPRGRPKLPVKPKR